MTATAYSITSIGSHRGSPRLWLQGTEPERGGFTPGSKFDVEVDAKRSLLTLVLDEDGCRTVSRKERKGRLIPVIDINRRDILALFEGLDAVRVVVEPGRIYILPVAAELKARERLDRLRERLAAGKPLRTGSMASGVGILDRAAHQGLAEEGINSELAFSNEIRHDCVAHALKVNPIYRSTTFVATAGMQHLLADQWLMQRVGQLDGLIAGIPCSAASLAGRAKHKMRHPEEHPQLGHLLVSFLAFVASTNPAFVGIENVGQFANTASMAIIRNQLNDLGYVVHEVMLDASDWNMLEARKRLCVIAVTRGIEFDVSEIERPERQERRLAEILDDIAPDDPRWSPMTYLKVKRERDAAKGSNFRMNVVDGNATRIGVLNATLSRRQSTGQMISHPTDPDLMRIPTVAEHARAKGVWPDMIEGVGQAFGHEILGQGVSVPPWVSVFRALGKALIRFARTTLQPKASVSLAGAVSA